MRTDALPSPCTPRVARSRTRNTRENDASASTERPRIDERGPPAVDVLPPAFPTISSPDKTRVAPAANSSILPEGGGGGGIPDAPAPEPTLGSLSFHPGTSLSISLAVPSAAGPDQHLLAPAPHTHQPPPPLSAAVAARRIGGPGRGAMEKEEKNANTRTTIPSSAAGGSGTGAKAGAGASQPAAPALSGPQGLASVPLAAGASPTSSPANSPPLAGVLVT